MPLTIHYPATDSASSTKPVISIPALVWSQDWVRGNTLGASNAASSVLIENRTTTLDTSETVMRYRKPIANVYANSGADRALWTTSTRGWKLGASLKSLPYVVSDDDPTYKAVTPITVKIEVSYAAHPLITAEVIEHYLARCLAAFASEGATSIQSGTDEMMHGGLLPKSL